MFLGSRVEKALLREALGSGTCSHLSQPTLGGHAAGLQPWPRPLVAVAEEGAPGRLPEPGPPLPGWVASSYSVTAP